MFKIDANLLQAIGNYLIQRPYNEVSALIEGLKKLEKVDGENQEAEPVVEPVSE